MSIVTDFEGKKGKTIDFAKFLWKLHYKFEEKSKVSDKMRHF